MTQAERAVSLFKKELEGRDVLEAACGSAEFSLAACGVARSVCGIDLVDERLIPGAAAKPGFAFRRMDAAAMAFPAGSFDAVVLYNAAAHVEAQAEAIVAEGWRVLRPGGCLAWISAWGLDKPVIRQRVAPLMARLDGECVPREDGPFLWIMAKKA